MDNASIHKSEELELMIENWYVNMHVGKIYKYSHVLVSEACVSSFFLHTHWISIQLKRLSLPSRHGYEGIETLLWVS
jgi:hypothetical protein